MILTLKENIPTADFVHYASKANTHWTAINWKKAKDFDPVFLLIER